MLITLDVRFVVWILLFDCGAPKFSVLVAVAGTEARPGQPCRLQYTPTQLRSMWTIASRVPVAVNRIAQQLGICLVGPTHRGRRSNQRRIPVRISNRARARMGQQHCYPTSLRDIHTVKWDIPTMVNTNICGGLSGKIDEISAISDKCLADVICLTETWCMSGVPDDALQLPGFASVRRDRQDGRQHGGLMMYIRNSVPYHHWNKLHVVGLETM